MKTTLLGLALAVLPGAAATAHGQPPPGGWRGPPVVYPGVPVRPLPPVLRPAYPGWGVGYWGPRAGVYINAPYPYWGPWPYAAPLAVAPWVVPPVPQVIVAPQPVPQYLTVPAPAPPAESFWYYCVQPAGYFPYVQNCSQAWMKVVPQVPGGSAAPPQLAP